MSKYIWVYSFVCYRNQFINRILVTLNENKTRMSSLMLGMGSTQVELQTLINLGSENLIMEMPIQLYMQNDNNKPEVVIIEQLCNYQKATSAFGL